MLAIYTYIQVHVYIDGTPKANGILGLNCLAYEKNRGTLQAVDISLYYWKKGKCYFAVYSRSKSNF